MHTGLLYFDNSTTTLQVKVQKAIDYYHKKFGKYPNLCLVNPSFLGGEKSIKVGELDVRPYKSILRGHLWIGIEDEN